MEKNLSSNQTESTAFKSYKVVADKAAGSQEQRAATVCCGKVNYRQRRPGGKDAFKTAAVYEADQSHSGRGGGGILPSIQRSNNENLK